MGFRTFLAMMLIAAGQVPVPDERPRPPAEDLARALQQRYDGIRDFSADFVHTYQGGVLRRKATEKGKVLIKKPGKMRWTYEAPEDKLFVSDGVKMYLVRAGRSTGRRDHAAPRQPGDLAGTFPGR